MPKEEPRAEPRGETPAPPPCACQADPALRLRPAADSGTGTRESDRTRGTAFGTSEFSKAGTQGEQTLTELVHPDCPVPQGLGSPPTVTPLSAPPGPYLSASSICWPLTSPFCASSSHDALCLAPSTQPHRGHRGNSFLRLLRRALVFPNSNLLPPHPPPGHPPSPNSQPAGRR